MLNPKGQDPFSRPTSGEQVTPFPYSNPPVVDAPCKVSHCISMALLLARQRDPSTSTSKGKNHKQEVDDNRPTPEATPRRSMQENLEHELKHKLASAKAAPPAQAPLPSASTTQTDPTLLNILQLLTAQSLNAQSQASDSKPSKVPDVKKPDVFNGSSAEDL